MFTPLRFFDAFIDGEYDRMIVEQDLTGVEVRIFYK